MINVRIKFRIDRTHEEEKMDREQQQDCGRGCRGPSYPTEYIHIRIAYRPV